MATNQLLPFASGESPNVLPFADWNSLPARLTGFKSGIASSQQFNYILAQGGSAGYVIGQLVADNTNQDATLDPESLYTNWKKAVAVFIPANVADGSIGGAKLTNNTVAFAKIASAAIATTQEAQEGESNVKLMTPARVKEAIEAQTPPAIPTGTLLPFAGTVVPEGFLLCNGANVSRTEYANLFAAIGTKWGEGDGSTTFTLPNFNDRFIEGTTDTEKVGQYLKAGAPKISGKVGPIDGFYEGSFYKGDSVPYGATSSREARNKANFDASLSSSIFGADSTIQPASAYSLIIIKE